MNIIGILLLVFLGTLILIFGVLAYEVWKILQIYDQVTGPLKKMANIRLSLLEKVAVKVIGWWKNRRGKVALWPFLCIFPFLTACCDSGPTHTVPRTRVPVLYENGDTAWYVTCRVIDSCEYFVEGHRMTHKGNCKYCKEREEKNFNRMLDSIASRR